MLLGILLLLYSPQKQLAENIARALYITKRDFILCGSFFCEKYIL